MQGRVVRGTARLQDLVGRTAEVDLLAVARKVKAGAPTSTARDGASTQPCFPVRCTHLLLTGGNALAYDCA